MASIDHYVLVHPVDGAIDLYRNHRRANQKQWRIMEFFHPTCTGPNCGTGAKYCQAHHVHEWRDGGPTNQSNLVTTCRYHNGINGYHGKIVKRGLHAYWQSPINGKLVPNSHRAARHGPLARL